MLKLDLTSKMRLWNFERQTDHLVSTRRSDLVLINKNKNFLKRGSQSANKNEKKKREVLEPCPRIENTVERKDDGDTDSFWYTWNGCSKD